MDKGTQEKVTERFDIRCRIICKGCKRLHTIAALDVPEYYVGFPKGDFSVIEAMCPQDDKIYVYNQNDLLWPTHEESSDLKNIEKRLERLEQRFSELMSKDDMARAKKELEESIVGFLSDWLSKQSVDAPKKAAYG
jgi:hypothetical protein